jgi:two-component system, NtrC family, response regulator AtoC
MSQSSPAKILVTDDDRSALDSLSEVLEREGYAVLRAESGAEALQLLSSESPDLVLTDLRMREIDGMKVLEAAQSSQKDLPVIVMTGFASMETTIDAIRGGAADYLSKPFKLDQVRAVVRRALEQASLRRENRKLRTAVDERHTEQGMIGRSPEMVEVYKLIARVAPLPTTVLIQGESGTGKEMVARLIHDTSSRSTGPFKTVNCGALPESLLESELFGYVKGAFTGAAGNKVGMFEAAHCGTCFLDEISNTTPALQMKLLRVLEEHEVLRVGSTDPIRVDVRIIAATNQPLEEMVKAHRFREDLFYRLKVVTVDLPPLRLRRGDIPLLLDHFVRRYAAASDRTIGIQELVYPMLIQYDWPGNVRELENAVERAIALNSSGVLTRDDFPAEIRRGFEGTGLLSKRLSPHLTLAQKEKEYILEILEVTGQNASRAAEILDIDRRTLYRILERQGIHRG